MGLRETVLAAIAEELEADCNAEAALDALLDTLAANGHEPLGPPAHDGEVEVGNTSVWTLIAALRVEGEEE